MKLATMVKREREIKLSLLEKKTPIYTLQILAVGELSAHGRNFRSDGRNFRTEENSSLLSAGPQTRRAGTSEPGGGSSAPPELPGQLPGQLPLMKVKTPESNFAKRNKERKFVRNFRCPELPQI